MKTAKSTLLNKLHEKQLINGIKAFSIKHLYLFGSRARGEERKDSDLDLVIDIDNYEGFTLFRLAELNDLISKRTGIKNIDFITQNSLKKKNLKPEIEKDLIQIF